MNEKIAAALKSIEGATPGPWETNGTQFSGTDGMIGEVGFGMRDDAEMLANAEQVALSPALGAALRLAAAVDGWANDGLPPPLKEIYDALDAFIAALPEVEK